MTPAPRLVDSLLVGAIACVLIAPVVARVVRRRFDPFEPVVLFALAYGAMFVVRPGAMIARDVYAYESARRTFPVSGTFTEMLVLALVGAVAFVGLYAYRIGDRLAALRRSSSAPMDDRRLVVASTVTGLVGLLAYLGILAASGLSETVKSAIQSGNIDMPKGSAAIYGSYLFLMLAPASLILLALGLEQRRPRFVVAGAAFGGSFFVLMLPIGGRIALLPLIGGLFVLLYVRRSRRPSPVTLVLVAIAAVLASTFLSDLRGRATRDESVGQTIARSLSPGRLEYSFTAGPDSEMAPALAVALTVIPERAHHTNGSTIFGDLVTRPIPRSLWQDKPLIPRHRLLERVWPVEYERSTINTEFSALLYFYWDFGIVGVFLGLGLYGLVFRYAYERFLRSQTQIQAQVLFSLGVWFVVIAVRDSPVDVFVRSVFVLGPIWAIFALARMSVSIDDFRTRHADPTP